MMGHKKLVGGVFVILLVFVSAYTAKAGSVPEGSRYTAQEDIAQLNMVPGWEQVNVNGFGDAKEQEVSALEVFNGNLYAGTHNLIDPLQVYDGARIFRSPDGVTWTAVTGPGFQNPHDTAPPAILDFVVFGSRLYASTGRGGNAAQIQRSTTGTLWAPMVTAGFGDPEIHDIAVLAVFNNMIYAGAGSQVSGAKIYRSSSGDSNTWNQVTPAASTMAGAGVSGFEAFNNVLYATVESEAPVQIWRSTNGSTWTVAVSNGFGDSQTTSTGGMAVFGGFLYVGAGNATTGAQLWRSSNGTSWVQAITPGFGDPNNKTVEMVFVFQGQLYVGVQNDQTGIEIWRSADGSQWEHANQDGFGDSKNTSTNGGHASAEFLSQLYVGTSNIVTGAELWRMLPPATPTHLLTVSKSGIGSGTVTSDPAGIHCGQDCSETYAANATVTLTASAANGSTFGGWGGGCSGTATCTVTMTATTNVSAVFNGLSQTFVDVPITHPYFQDIEILYANGLTGGCSTNPLKFCPDQIMDRAMAAVFMMRGAFGSGYAPNPTAHLFQDDWTKGAWARPWAEAMRETNLTTGCKTSPFLYCPWVRLPREQVVIFGLKMRYGNSYQPPAATGNVFADMTNPSYYATAWAEKAYADGLIEACGTVGGKPKFCPKTLVTRGLGAYVIVRAKNLSMP